MSPSNPLTPRDGGLGNAKPQKSKSFINSLKHLTIPRRKHHKDKHNTSMSSQASSTSQLNTSLQSPPTNTVSHSLSSGEIYIHFVWPFVFVHILNLIQLYRDHILAVCLCMLISVLLLLLFKSMSRLWRNIFDFCIFFVFLFLKEKKKEIFFI